ncbi:unnamed protein product [Toxocara canis]|uniref:SET domain-containing protein n=1 Tax=Toxocara canis TaxID=6265 RepID=A0A183UVB4_TOXCA|nr:unnamed protein product [Toxocara canis]
MDEVEKTPNEEKRFMATIQVKHLRALSDACLRLGVPAPVAAVHSRKAFSLLKLSPSESVSVPLYQGAEIEHYLSQNRIVFSLERSKSASVIAVCSGCGSTMQCGRIYRPQNDCFGDTFEESVCLSLDCTRTSVKQTGIASIVSTPRRVSFDSTPHSNRFSVILLVRWCTKNHRYLLSANWFVIIEVPCLQEAFHQAQRGVDVELHPDCKMLLCQKMRTPYRNAIVCLHFWTL